MWLLPLIAASTMTTANLEPFLIGAYTSPGGSEGPYTCSLDPVTGVLGTPVLIGASQRPSFVVWGKSENVVYAIEEADGAHVRSFVKKDTWEEGSDSRWNGQGPCHLALSHDGRHLAAAGYADGTLGFFGAGPGGELTPALSEFKNTGSGPYEGRQEGPHMHMVAFSPDDRFLLACDLGTDEVLSFPVQGGKLGAPLRHSVNRGGGARHLVFTPDGTMVYVNDEMGNAVTAMKRDPATGAMENVQTLPTLPPDYKGQNTTAEIVLHPSGKWLYVSNRGHDSVAVYRIVTAGKLELAGIDSVHVKEPRGMDVDPSGKWLVVAGQNSGDIVSLPVDPATGRPGGPKSTIKASKAVCIMFRRR